MDNAVEFYTLAVKAMEKIPDQTEINSILERLGDLQMLVGLWVAGIEFYD